MLSRRSVLRGAGVIGLAEAAGLWGALSGCTPTPARTVRRRTPGAAAPATGDAALLVAAIADEERLLDHCDSVLAQHRALGVAVAPVRQVQSRHVAVMRLALVRLDPPRSTTVDRVPRGAGPALADLRDHVAEVKRDRLLNCLAAESGLVARLFASASAAHAVSVDTLRRRTP